ncbi:MAG: hypothetical protein ABI639_14465 [Thermoanaerobaculia bacterium]
MSSVVVSLKPEFEGQVTELVAELEAALQEGPEFLDVVLAALPARIRRIVRSCVVARVVDRNPPDADSMRSPSNPPKVGEGLPTGSRAGRPLGLNQLRGELRVKNSRVPLFTKYRTDRELSRSAISALAKRAGVEISASTICNLELGDVAPAPYHVLPIALALGVDINEARRLLGLPRILQLKVKL